MASWLSDVKELPFSQVEQPSSWPPVLVYLGTILSFLVPSFIHRAFSAKPAKADTMSSIKSLDGLRGVACFIVFNEHFTVNFSDSFLYGYGVEKHRSIIQMPFIRTFWAGAGMVAVFFVISGYVLSYKPLKLMRANQVEKSHSTLSSSVFRRAVRLYLPSIAAVLITGFLSWAGVFDLGSDNFYDEGSGVKLREDPPPRFDSLFFQMWDAIKNSMKMFSLWYWGRQNVTPGNYDWHLWTIPVEYRSSMVLFMLLLATSKLQQLFRLLCTGGMIGYCIYTDRRDVLLFVSGMFLAEIDMIRKSEMEDRKKDETRLLWIVLFVIGCFFMSAPVYDAEHTLGYQLLTQCIPKYYQDLGIAIESVGAILMVWCVANSTQLESLFANRVSTYLGKISYALYLVHGNLIKALLYAIMPELIKLSGARYSSKGMVFAWVLGMCITLPVTIILSDLFWRSIDLPSVDFARWLEKKVSISENRDEVKSHSYHLVEQRA